MDRKTDFTDIFNPLGVIVRPTGGDRRARLDMGNTYHGLIFVYLTFAAPLSTWLLMGYFRGIPADLEEQAMVDGATRLQAFYKITMPLAVPGLIAVGVLTFTSAWNELLLALIFTTSPDLQTVPVAISYLITGDVFRFGLIMAASVSAAVSSHGIVLFCSTICGTGTDCRGGQRLIITTFLERHYDARCTGTIQ